MGISNIIFILLFVALMGYFFMNVRKLVRNIKLAKTIDRNDHFLERLKTMLLVAFGQGKMLNKPIAGIMHIIVYVGFLIINLEVLEIVVDGVTGSHRYFYSVIGPIAYNSFTQLTEYLALLVIVAVFVFFIRRNVQYIRRFRMKELKGWPKNDANYILIIEFILMMAFLTMNAADNLYMLKSDSIMKGSFPISKILLGWSMQDLSVPTLHFIEKFNWWLHIIGILLFLNYLYWSKHLHILLAFPNTFFAKLEPKTELDDLESVKKEVELMMDPEADPYETPAENENAEHASFGASDIFDLNRVQLLNAYTCTECGRCTAVCPANLTGKKLSPRNIMMKVRDRTEEVGKNIDKNKSFQPDGKKLLGDYITDEELWACTTCNACTEACPVLIDPVSIIIDLRRYLVMEESRAPQELNIMMSNIENNGAPWPYNQADRLNWEKE